MVEAGETARRGRGLSGAARWRSLRDFVDEVTQRWQSGEHNGRALYDRIRAPGYPGSDQVRLRFLQPLRQKQLEASAQPAVVPAVVTLFF